MTAVREGVQDGADRTEAGFTLLEVIVALMLLSILVVALSGSLSFGTRVWEHTSRSARARGDLISAYQFLDLSFGRLAKQSSGASQQNQSPDFTGTSQVLTFRTDGFAAVGLPGPHFVKLEVVDRRLQVSVLDPNRAPIVAGDRDFVLADSTESVLLAYRGYDGVGSDTGWVGDWLQDRSPPSFVRVTIVRSGDQSQTWVFRLPDASLSEGHQAQ
jgi:general secretion pathway protein J